MTSKAFELAQLGDAVTVNSSKVGINTSSPDLKLDVSHGTTAEYVATFQNTADNLELKIGTTTGGLLNIQGANASNNNAYDFSLNADGGNVGINNTSFSSYSSSARNLVIGSSGSNGITIASGTSNSGNIYFADGTSGNTTYRGYIQYQHNVDKLVLGAGSDDRVFIDSSGNFLVGKSTYNNDDNGAAIVPSGTSWFTATNDYPLGVNRKGSDGTLITFTNDQAGCGTIACSGSSTSYNTSSDYRLKENVVDVSDGITRVKQLAPKRFNFIADADTTVDGFLAHEAQAVVPEAVTGTHNEVDDDGNPVYQGIDQAKLVPLLTAALQEAIEKIETLETKVAALEGA